MGFSFHKSFRVGKNSRINVSKSGVGFSTGVKGFRIRFSPSRKKKSSGPTHTREKVITTSVSSKSKGFALLLCVLFGYIGCHYFYVGRWGMGLIYLCTGGLFMIGWIVDIFKIIRNRFLDKAGAVLA